MRKNKIKKMFEEGKPVINGVKMGNFHPPGPITRIGTELTRQGRGMKGGGSMWRNLGLSIFLKLAICEKSMIFFRSSK